MTPSIDHQLKTLIEKAAGKHGLSPNVVYGICMTESSMNHWAARHEPDYRWLYEPSKMRPSACSLITEINLQQTSWGLMQVMGAVFRELGFRGWLTAVAGDPALQLEYGCRHLAGKIKRFGFFEGLLAYNAGSPRRDGNGEYVNFGYARKVAGFVQQAREAGIFENADDSGVTWLAAANG